MAARVILSVAWLGLCALSGRADEPICAGVNGAFSPDGGRVAFQRDAGAETHLGVVDLKTGEVVWIERGPGRAAFPTWTRDGALVYSYGDRFHTAYATWRGNLTEGYGLRRWKDGVKTDLTRDRRYDYSPCVAPDGKTLYWVSTKGFAFKGPAVGDIRSGLWQGPLENPEAGTPVVRLPMESAGVGQPAVSPDGRQLVWAQLAGFGSSWKLCSAKVGDWAHVTVLTPPDMAAYAPNWSPDGKSLAFTGYREGDSGWCVYLMTPGSGAPQRICRGENAAFSPDGRSLVYDDGATLYLHRLREEPVAEVQESFEVLALVDSLDFAAVYDIETATGTVQTLEHVLLTHPTSVLWRDKGGSLMRYPSAEEASPYDESPLDKRRLPRQSVYGYLRLNKCAFDVWGLVFGECARRGLGWGVHTTWEESHWVSTTESNWNLRHPQFTTRAKRGSPRLASCSLAFPEVMAHKLRLVDERLALKPKTIFLDLFRSGGWSPGLEYVKPVCDAWRARYGCEPPESGADPRWLSLVAEWQMAYVRAFAAKCHAAGVRFLLGFAKLDLKDDHVWTHYALDWKALAAEGALDGVVAMGVVADPKRPFESTREILDYACAHRGKAKVYFHASMYDYNGNGIPTYCRWTKVSSGEAATRLLSIARDAGCAGAVLECVDYGNYPESVRQALEWTNPTDR